MLKNNWISFTRPVYTKSKARADRANNFCFFMPTVTVKRNVFSHYGEKRLLKKKKLKKQSAIENWKIGIKKITLCTTQNAIITCSISNSRGAYRPWKWSFINKDVL